MDDQVFADDLSLESLIREGHVTHLCSGGADLDEAAVLTALCDAVAGQIYRIDPLTYVFRICEDDLGGALAGTPSEDWAGTLARRVRGALRLPAEAGGLQVRALRREQAADQPQPQAVESPAGRDAEPEPQDAAFSALPDDRAAQDWPAEEAEPMEAPQAEPGEESRREGAEEPQVEELRSEPAEEAPAATSAPDAVLARLDALELRLGELQSCMTGLAAQAAAQTEASRSLERAIGELAQARREAPESAAAHPTAQTGVLAPLAVALTSALRRMEEQEAASDLAVQLAPVQDGLGQLRDEIMALSRRLEAQSAAPEDLAQRLDGLSADLRGLPERAAAQVTARTGSLAPMHVALSGALHRLERQIEALAAIGPDAGPDAGLRLAMAEFLSRLEQGILIPTAD